MARVVACFDIPHSMDDMFRTRQIRGMVYTRPSNLACAITPLVVTAIFHHLWGIKGGLNDVLPYGQAMSQSTIKAGYILEDKDESNREDKEDKEKEADDDVSESSMPSLLARRFGNQASTPLSDTDSMSSKESILPALFIGGQASSSEDTSRDTDVGIPSHGWDLETYEIVLPGKCPHQGAHVPTCEG